MRMKKTIRKRTISLALAMLMAFGCMINTPVTSAAPPTARTVIPDLSLGAAQGYNLVCFGDFTNGTTDIEGKAFIGGNIKTNGGFTFGDPTKSHSTITEDDYSLVMGSIETNSFTVTGGGTSACKALVNKNTTISNYTFQGGIERWNNIDDLKKKTGIDLTKNDGISNFQQQMINKSKNMNDFITGNSTTIKIFTKNKSNELVFSGTNSHLNIFSIDASVLNQNPIIRLDTPSTSTDIINVTGEDAVKIPLVNGKDGSNLSDQYKLTHLLWNLNSTKNVSNWKDNSIKGSVLAPLAKFTGDGSNYEGTLIVDSFHVLGSSPMEGHDYPFTTDLTLAKTAKLKSWEERTYDINLSASANKVTYETPCDIVMVLDRSASMNDAFSTSSGTMQLNVKVDSERVNSVANNTYHGSPESNYGSYESPQYEIKIGNDYKVVKYDSNHSSPNKWYWLDSSQIRQYVHPVNDGTGTNQGYQFYIQTTVRSNSRMMALKSEAKNFVTQVSNLSPNSQIDVVSFASKIPDPNNKEWELHGWNYYNSTINETGSPLPVKNSSDVNRINASIDNIFAFGGTQTGDALIEAKKCLSDKSNDGHKKIVILFTDGSPSHQATETDAVRAAGELKSSLNATVITIGIFDESTANQRITFQEGTHSNYTIQSFMKALASFKQQDNTQKLYFTASDTSGLKNVFNSISHEILGTISDATITDVIDPRFNVLDDKGNVITNTTTLANNGAVSYDNSLNAWKVTWNTTILPQNADGSPGWSEKITIKAKDEFIGGNNISTNVAASSGVTYGDNIFTPFPDQPSVNVKAVLEANNREATIFRGQQVDNSLADQCKGWKDTIVNYRWFLNDSPIAKEKSDFPTELKPDDDVVYTLKATFDAGPPTWESTYNSGGNMVRTAPDDYILKVQGTYTVNVVKGELKITKIIDDVYPAHKDVLAQQSFVFKIDRFDYNTDLTRKLPNPVETFYEVITPDATGSTGMTKTITGLKKGCYRITEETGTGTGAWRYKKIATEDNDELDGSTKNDYIVKIGRKMDEPIKDNKIYFGAQEKIVQDPISKENRTIAAANPATITFNNKLEIKKWLGDTTVVVNTISPAPNPN